MQRRRIKGNGTAANGVGGNKEINLSTRVYIYIYIILYTVRRCEIASGIDLYNYLIIKLEKNVRSFRYWYYIPTTNSYVLNVVSIL